jgi:hypothetical protein
MFAYRSVCRLFLLSLVALVITALPVAAQQKRIEMRIETDVFVDNQDKPTSHTVTLFDSDTVYDFFEEPAQITVFRLPSASHAGSFIMLDLEAKQRTEVSTKKIAGLMKKLTRWAGEQEDELLKFSAQPKFEKTFDEETGMLTLESSVWNYSVATVPANNEKALARYREFSDWYTRLNSMLHSTPPPGARLKLNAALAEHGVVPVEIRRTVQSESKSLRATHMFTWRLSREDRDRIETAQKHLAKFNKVGNEEFLTRMAGRDVVRGQSR